MLAKVTVRNELAMAVTVRPMLSVRPELGHVAVLGVLAAVLPVLGVSVLAVAGRPLHHHYAVGRLDAADAVLGGAQAPGLHEAGHLLADRTTAGRQAPEGAAGLGGPGPRCRSSSGAPRPSTQRRVVAAGVLVVLRGALDAAQVAEATVHHLLRVVRHRRHVHHGAGLHGEGGDGDGATATSTTTTTTLLLLADLGVAAGFQDGDGGAAGGAHRLARVGGGDGGHGAAALRLGVVVECGVR